MLPTAKCQARCRAQIIDVNKWWHVRIGALNTVYGGQRRYGDGKLYVFSDDDAGRDDLRILLDHYASSNPAAMPRIIRSRAPWMTEAERQSLMAQVGRRPRYWTSPALADALGLTEAERVAHGRVPTIGAVDVTPDERKEMRRRRNTEQRRQKRRAAKVRPRSEYLATHSTSRERPWEAEGISRPTWYRRRETTLSAVNLLNTADRPVSTPERSRAAGKPLQDAHVQSISAKRNPGPFPATESAYKEAA